MRKIFLLVFGIMILSLGCARVRVEAPKEPIKLDISMRLDIYQHVEKDIDDIENMVSGGSSKQALPNKNGSSLRFFVKEAYAEEGLNPEVEKAVLSRKNRRAELVSYEEKGIIGENKNGLVEIRNPESAQAPVYDMINLENADRMVIYGEIAKKNNISIEEVQKLYAERLQRDANQGTHIQAINSSTGQYEWQVK